MRCRRRRRHSLKSIRRRICRWVLWGWRGMRRDGLWGSRLRGIVTAVAVRRMLVTMRRRRKATQTTSRTRMIKCRCQPPRLQREVQERHPPHGEDLLPKQQQLLQSPPQPPPREPNSPKNETQRDNQSSPTPTSSPNTTTYAKCAILPVNSYVVPRAISYFTPLAYDQSWQRNRVTIGSVRIVLVPVLWGGRRMGGRGDRRPGGLGRWRRLEEICWVVLPLRMEIKSLLLLLLAILQSQVRMERRRHRQRMF
mmetsp:Transcript_8390/g.18795  ORF Transcript_8390/g.18795 Transcript_8390/m.18795 type:complete len:252 (-) Transcript_8390:3269-4024(-)